MVMIWARELKPLRGRGIENVFVRNVRRVDGLELDKLRIQIDEAHYFTAPPGSDLHSGSVVHEPDTQYTASVAS